MRNPIGTARRTTHVTKERVAEVAAAVVGGGSGAKLWDTRDRKTRERKVPRTGATDEANPWKPRASHAKRGSVAKTKPARDTRTRGNMQT